MLNFRIVSSSILIGGVVKFGKLLLCVRCPAIWLLAVAIPPYISDPQMQNSTTFRIVSIEPTQPLKQVVNQTAGRYSLEANFAPTRQFNAPICGVEYHVQEFSLSFKTGDVRTAFGLRKLSQRNRIACPTSDGRRLRRSTLKLPALRRISDPLCRVSVFSRLTVSRRRTRTPAANG